MRDWNNYRHMHMGLKNAYPDAIREHDSDKKMLAAITHDNWRRQATQNLLPFLSNDHLNELMEALKSQSKDALVNFIHSIGTPYSLDFITAAYDAAMAEYEDSDAFDIGAFASTFAENYDHDAASSSDAPDSITIQPPQKIIIGGNAQVELIGLTFDSIVIENNAHVNFSNVTVGKITAGYRSTFSVTDSEIGRIFVGNSASGTVDSSQVGGAFTKDKGKLTGVETGRWKEYEPPVLMSSPQSLTPQDDNYTSDDGNTPDDGGGNTQPEPEPSRCDCRMGADSCGCVTDNLPCKCK